MARLQNDIKDLRRQVITEGKKAQAEKDLRAVCQELESVKAEGASKESQLTGRVSTLSKIIKDNKAVVRNVSNVIFGKD